MNNLQTDALITLKIAATIAIIESTTAALAEVIWQKSSKNFLYNSLHLNIREYTFQEHDETIAFSLSIPFASTLVFASVMKHQEAPGTTFKRHMAIAHGLMSEDDYLLQEILFNPHTSEQLEKIQKQLSHLQEIVKNRDSIEMKKYLDAVRDNLK